MKTDSITWQHTHNLLALSQHLASHFLQDHHHNLVMKMNRMTPSDASEPTSVKLQPHEWNLGTWAMLWISPAKAMKECWSELLCWAASQQPGQQEPLRELWCWLYPKNSVSLYSWVHETIECLAWTENKTLAKVGSAVDVAGCSACEEQGQQHVAGSPLRPDELVGGMGSC